MAGLEGRTELVRDSVPPGSSSTFISRTAVGSIEGFQARKSVVQKAVLRRWAQDADRDLDSALLRGC